MVQDREVLTMADHQEVVYDLSSGAIFSDLESAPVPAGGGARGPAHP